MTFQSSSVRAISPNHYVGIAIKAIPGANRAMHVGLVYRSANRGIRFAHLAFHHTLCDDAVSNDSGYWWSDCMWLADDAMRETARFMASYVESVVRTMAIDYGMDSRDVGFDSAGQYYSLDPRRGLTCATFVAAVFQGAGCPVVRLETWERRAEDMAWRDGVLRMLAEYGAEHRSRELADVDVPFRLTPAEAAVAAADPEAPLDFARAVERSLPLLASLFPKSED